MTKNIIFFNFLQLISQTSASSPNLKGCQFLPDWLKNSNPNYLRQEIFDQLLESGRYNLAYKIYNNQTNKLTRNKAHNFYKIKKFSDDSFKEITFTCPVSSTFVTNTNKDNDLCFQKNDRTIVCDLQTKTWPECHFTHLNLPTCKFNSCGELPNSLLPDKIFQTSLILDFYGYYTDTCNQLLLGSYNRATCQARCLPGFRFEFEKKSYKYSCKCSKIARTEDEVECFWYHGGHKLTDRSDIRHRYFECI